MSWLRAATALGLAASFGVSGCGALNLGPRGGAVAPRDCPQAAALSDSVFLVGDAGAPKLSERADPDRPVDPVLSDLRRDVLEKVEQLGVEHVLVVYLGDNVYPRGLVSPGEADRLHGERVLEAQIGAAGPARVIFTAGNHDWDRQGARGWEHIREQQAFLADRGPRVSMLPPGGCAGPERVDFGRHLAFVFIDPIGFDHAVDFPERHVATCPHGTALEAFLDLSAEFDHPEGRHMVLALHHPMITAGPHGGHFTWKQHIFPLTDFWGWAWLPLPVVGSVYPLSRQLGVTGTDAASRVYREYIMGIYQATRPRVPILFAAGHEHSLQVHRDPVGAYYAVSGAGSSSKVNRVERAPTAMFAEASPGFMRLDAHLDGSLGLSVFARRLRGEHEPVFRHCLTEGPPQLRRPRR